MKHTRLLTILSLLSVVLLSLHITDDIVRGISPPGADNLGAVAIFVVWLCGILLLSERRSGYLIMFLGGLFGAAMPVLHMRGSGYVRAASSSGGFFFIWTLFAVGTTGVLAMILAARGFWLLRPGKAR